jgi:hypothetical protein
MDNYEQNQTEVYGEAAHINRYNLRASPWERRGMRLSDNGKWQPGTENRRGRLDAGELATLK